MVLFVPRAIDIWSLAMYVGLKTTAIGKLYTIHALSKQQGRGSIRPSPKQYCIVPLAALLCRADDTHSKHTAAVRAD
jgi:hypothetical protein